MSGKSLVFKFGADMSQFRTAMDNAAKSTQKLGKKMQKVGKDMSTYVTAPIAALGAVSVKTFSNFEQGMAKVQAISGATVAEFDALTENAKKLGASTRYTAAQVAELQLNYSKLGFAPEEINKVTGATLNLALATGEDLAQSATVAASTLRGFGLEASEMGSVTDVMANSFSSSALDLEKFSTAMAALAPVAKNAGVSLEQSTSFLSILVDRGVDASTAGTGLRNMFLDLSKHGISLNDALARINDSSNKNATAMDLFGKRGATVASIMAENIGEAAALEIQYNNSSGAASRMASIMDDTLQGSMLRLQSATEAMGIEFGEVMAPTVRMVAKLLGKLATWFSSLSDTTKKWVVVIGAIVAAIGPFVLALGTIMQLAPVVATGLAAIATAFNAINWPIVAVVAAIAAFVAAGIYMWDNWEAITQNMTKAWVATKNFLLDGIIALVKGITWFSTTVLEALGFDALSDGVDFIVGKLEGLKEPLPDVSAEFGSFGESVSNVMDAVMGSTQKATQEVQNTGNAVVATTEKVKTFGEETRKAIEPLPVMTTNTTGEFVKLEEGVSSVTESMQEMGSASTLTFESFNEKVVEVANKINSVVSQVKTVFSGLYELMGALRERDDAKDKASTDAKIARINKQVRADVLTAKQGEEAKALVFDQASRAAADKRRKQWKIDKAAAITLAAINGALAVTQALGGLPPPASYVAAGVSAAAAAIQIGIIAAKPMPAFADGGLVFGATTALVGEGSGTTRSNPEVIAPLDKLMGYMGGVNNNVTVAGVIRGEDIYLSNTKGALAYANIQG